MWQTARTLRPDLGPPSRVAVQAVPDCGACVAGGPISCIYIYIEQLLKTKTQRCLSWHPLMPKNFLVLLLVDGVIYILVLVPPAHQSVFSASHLAASRPACPTVAARVERRGISETSLYLQYGMDNPASKTSS